MKFSSFIAMAIGCYIASPVFADVEQSVPEQWTLETSARRILNIAHEIRVATAEIEQRTAEAAQAGVWSNPSVELRTDNKLGQEDGNNGYDVTAISISQALPINGHLRYKRKQAETAVESAQAALNYQKLRLEQQAATGFHTLQLTGTKYNLARQRVRAAEEIRTIGKKREQAGDISRLELLRLNLVYESALQELASAEGEYSEALTNFRSLMSLPSGTSINWAPLEIATPPPSLIDLQTQLTNRHPAVIAAMYDMQTAQAGIAIARAQRLPDPTLSIFQERDFLNGQREAVTGFAVNLPLPLWDSGKNQLRQSIAKADETLFNKSIVQRDLEKELAKSHLHLSHLIEQSQRYRTDVLDPAREVFDLTRKSFAEGEAELLSLIDGNDTHFQAQAQYFELLHQAWLELANLRLSAGIFLNEAITVQSAGEHQ